MFVKAVVILHAQTRCRPVHARGFTAGQKTVENQDRAAGPSLAAGRWAVAGRGPRAAGLRAAWPLGRRGPWACF